MLPSDEILREESSNLGVSYSNLLGLEFNGETNKYNNVDIETVEALEEKYKVDDNPNYYYFEDTCTVPHLYACVKAVIVDYKNREGLDDTFTDEQGVKHRPKFIVAIDHSLLLDTIGKEDVLSMMSTLGKMAIRFKKMGFLTIIVGQFNGNIESTERIRNPNLHFPMKSDIYAQGEIYNACDGVFTIHQPELMGILYYGKNQYKTENLVHLQVLKMRFGKVGSVWLKNNLEKGVFTNYPSEMLKSRGEDI